MALRLGAAAVLDASEGDVAVNIKELTLGRGADVCVEASRDQPCKIDARRDWVVEGIAGVPRGRITARRS